MNIRSQLASLRKIWKGYHTKIPFYPEYRVTVNHALKAFFKNFPTFVMFIFAKTNKNIVYIAFRSEVGFGDILRQKMVLTEAIKFFTCCFIDNHGKAWLLLKDIRNIVVREYMVTLGREVGV